METLEKIRYTDTQRMELRSFVNLAGEVIAHFWPMRTFIHHNILHGMEYLDFEAAVLQGQRFLGGKPYLSTQRFRDYFQAGRIRLEHIDAALKPLVQDKSVTIGERCITHFDVLRVHLLQGITTSSTSSTGLVLDDPSEMAIVEALADQLQNVVHPQKSDTRAQTAVQEDRKALVHCVTLSGWCDSVLGTKIAELINGELIKWCGAFFDEGHATWSMPMRDKTMYDAWKILAQQEFNGAFLGIPGWRQKLEDLPERPEDLLLACLENLGIPKILWPDYMSLQLGALPGWAGFIKWRSEETAYEWQQAYPASLVKYLAIRLWYEQELVAAACGEELALPGEYGGMTTFMHEHSHAYFIRRERVAGRLPSRYARQVDQLRFGGHKNRDRDAWDSLGERYLTDSQERYHDEMRRSAAGRVVVLAKALKMNPEVLRDCATEDIRILLEWLDGFPETQHGPRWLEAFEAGYRAGLLEQLTPNVPKVQAEKPDQGDHSEPRPAAQAVFCIDVRSEGFRRHLEHVGGYETLGFAGFFGIPLRFRAFGGETETDQCPVLLKPKHVIREVQRTYSSHKAKEHLAGLELTKAGHTLFHDLKENVITPYVMVETVGWFFSLPFLGKTLFPIGYRKALDWFRRMLAPPIATSLTVDKLTKDEAHEMVAAEQRAIIHRVLRERLGRHGAHVSPDLVEVLRQRALDEDGDGGLLGEEARQLGMTVEAGEAFLFDLRTQNEINARRARTRLDRITKAGFTLDEQATFVETNLRLMGLTSGFARLVFLCAHGSTSENNPFESALDCGACGGNHGMPNARVMTTMGNKAQIREQLAKHGIQIPPDTHFIAGQVDTTTDEVQIFDLEDVPSTHRKDVSRLLADLKEAGQQNSQERCARFPDVKGSLSLDEAASEVKQRSLDWSQVRPEWGLSGNAAFIVGGRRLTKGLNLQGRTFLHSYDYRGDPTGKFLQVILTAPGVVIQWISMEHYFSTVDPEVYGSGSKMYHNIASRIGVMFGTQSDLRVGLAWQTVMDGERPYHEPMRPLYIVETPRERLTMLIRKNHILQRFFDGRWVHLVALEPDEGVFYRYLPKQEWVLEPIDFNS